MVSTEGGSKGLFEKLDPEAERRTRRLIDGAVRTQALSVVANLGIADLLSLRSHTAQELADRVHAHGPTLRRILRLLVSHGVFVEEADGRFGLNPAAEYLQSAHPRSLRDAAIRAGGKLWQLAGGLIDATRTGTTPHVELLGAEYFEQMLASGGSRSFDARMARSALEIGTLLAENESVVAGRTVVDIGGGQGALLIGLLKARPHLRGILLDRRDTITEASRCLAEANLADRCEVMEGNFFDAIPSGGDVYVLSWILHDWDDERALRILQNCKSAGAETLLLVEALLPERAQALDDDGPQFNPFALDLQMLLLTGGRERSLDEFRALLEQAGFRLENSLTPRSSRGATILHAVGC